MTRKRTVILGGGAALVILTTLLLLILIKAKPTSIRGAVITANADPAKQLPVADVEVTIQGGSTVEAVHSDASGFFGINLSWHMPRSERLILHFQHPDYQPTDLYDVAGDRLYIAQMIPSVPARLPSRPNSDVTIANIIARYSVNTITPINVGSAVKTFAVVNRANVPCKGQQPCSPDGKWKASIGSAAIDAGPGNEFHNARASCIAGPCPFTRIDSAGPGGSRDSRTFRVSARNWSDTATFVLEAEVYKPYVNGALRRSYPVILGRALTFTLPVNAEGVSIQAELNGSIIVFPLGPSLFLSWASCQVVVNSDQTRVFRCELKPGFRLS